MSRFTDEQNEILSGPMHPAMVAKHPYTKMDYVKGWQVEAMLNSVFGHDGWESTVQSLTREYIDSNASDQWRVAYTCVAALTVHGPGGSITHTGVGTGSGDSKNVTDAIDSAAKEAATDALKRAAKRLGWPMGLACYDQSGRHYGVRKKTEQPESELKPEPAEGPTEPPTTVTDKELAGIMIDIAEMDVAASVMLGEMKKATATRFPGRSGFTKKQSSAWSGMARGLPLLQSGQNPGALWNGDSEEHMRKYTDWMHAMDFCPPLMAWASANAADKKDGAS